MPIKFKETRVPTTVEIRSAAETIHNMTKAMSLGTPIGSLNDLRYDILRTAWSALIGIARDLEEMEEEDAN